MSAAPEMAEYRLKRTFRGQPCELYFFASWSGYSHPVKPQQPLRYQEALSRPAFCKAYLGSAKFGPAFVFFREQTHKRTRVELRVPLRSNGVAERYFAVIREGDSIVAGMEIEAQDAVDADEYLHTRFPPGVDALRDVELVQVEDWYSFEYFYDEGGALVKYVVRNSEGTHNIFEQGKPPQISFPIDRQR